ncbi:Hypothetical protein HVR_LOCUS686 [uncultured virus]|nr:Hypothetical protein HVR_LOCUS686 [uncultured virus]
MGTCCLYYRHKFGIFDSSCAKCKHKHYNKCLEFINDNICKCGHYHINFTWRNGGICGSEIHTKREIQYVERELVDKPIYETKQIQVPITKYRYETQEVEEDVTKYNPVKKTRIVSKYKTELRERKVTRQVSKGKYVTETFPVNKYQPGYYPDGSGRFTSTYESRQKYITYTEPETITERYNHSFLENEPEEYIENVPYTVREKVTKTIAIPYSDYETRSETIIVGYNKVYVDVTKTKVVDHVDHCQCKTTQWRKKRCNCIRNDI